MADTVETAVYRLRVEGQDQIDRLTKSVDGLAVSEEKAASSTRTFSQALQNNVARIDPLVRAQEQYRKALETNLRYRETGVGTEAQLNAQLEASTKRYQQQVTVINQVEKATVSHTNAQKLQGYQMLNLSRQIQDVGVSLFGGMSPITVMAQQLPQIFDISQQSGVSLTNMFKQAGAAALGFVTPMNVAIGAVAALAATVLSLANAWDKAQVSSQRALSGVGARSGTTVTDLNNFVAKNSSVSTTGLSGAEARELASAFASTGKIVVSQLDDMSNAVIGFANQTGKSTKEVIGLMAQFATDPVKGLEEMEKVWGDVDVKTRDAVKSMSDARDNTGAFNLILRATSEESAKAAKNLSVLDQATRLLFSSREIGFKPTGIEDQVEAARKRVEAAMNAKTPQGAPDQSAFNAEAVRALEKAYEDLFAAQQKLIDQGMTLKMNEMAKAVGVVEQSIIPQIAAIEKLTTSIEALEIAKAKGVAGPLGAKVDADALTIAKGTKQDAIETMAAQARITEETNKTAAAHQDVSRAVAMQLSMLEKQTALAGAVGGAEKMAAQYAIDYAEAKRQGATAAEANAIASEKQAATQAAINAAARETLFSLQNQASAAGAVTGAQQMAAQAAATYNQMVHDGVDAMIAGAVAAQQLANAAAAANANIERQIKSLNQSTEMIQAQTADLGTGAHNAEMMAAAGQAYTNAIESGASATAAAALSSATIANYMAKAAKEAKQMALAEEQASEAALKTALAAAKGNIWAPQNLDRWGVQNQPTGSSLPLIRTVSGWAVPTDFQQIALANSPQVQAGWAAMDNPKQPTTPAAQDMTDYYLKQGGVDYALSQLMAPQGATGALSAAGLMTPDYSTISSLYDLKNQQTTDKGQQAANLQQELAWLQSQPETLARDQSISQLKSSIDSLVKSTDSLNATNQELLSPYYTQDPRTSHIGFRSQGMAAGGYVDVPGGVSTNDNMIATIPVASGERIYIDPMNNRRSTSSGSGMVINISSPITINGNANVDQFGRTVFQANQQLAKSVRAATQ